MKLAFVMPPFLPMPPILGGAVETLTDLLLKANSKACMHEITVYCVLNEQAKDAQNEYTNCDFIQFKAQQTKAKDYLDRAKRKIFKIEIIPQSGYIKNVVAHVAGQKYDAVIVENVAQYVMPLSKACPNVLLHMHNSYLGEHIGWSAEVISKSKGILCVSDFLKHQALTTANVDKSKIDVLYNCVDCKEFDGEKHQEFANEFRKQKMISQNSTVFMYTGRLIPEKGVMQLIKAFLTLDRDAYLVIVGSGWFLPGKEDNFTLALRSIAQEKADKIIFTGLVNYKDMPKYYAIADAVVLPSIWEEPAGLTALEGMASGKPIIATGSGGMKEYINDVCAITVTRGEELEEQITTAMRLLADDKLIAQAMGIAGKEQAQKFDVNCYFDQFNNVLEKLVKK